MVFSFNKSLKVAAGMMLLCMSLHVNMNNLETLTASMFSCLLFAWIVSCIVMPSGIVRGEKWNEGR